MAKVIAIPRVGNISFPDEISDQEIAAAASEAHGKAMLSAVMRFVQADQSFRKLPASEAYKQLAAVAGILEKYPRLIRAIDAGMAKVSNPTAIASAAQRTQAPAPPSTAEQSLSETPSEPPSANAGNSTTNEE
jgi:hypothetical protein